jgi:dephospho-CoA kinase
LTIQIFTSGRMGSGKDVFADYLVEKHGFVKTAFADGIRRTIREYDPTYKPKSDRQKEIEVGNSFRRWFGDDFWINEALTELARSRRTWVPRGGGWYEEQINNVAGYVISDGRFPLEYEICVKQRGFIHVHIHADATVRKKRLLARDGKFNEEHFYSPDDCQIPITDSTIVLENNGYLEEFYQKIDQLITRLQEVDVK